MINFRINFRLYKVSNTQNLAPPPLAKILFTRLYEKYKATIYHNDLKKIQNNNKFEFQILFRSCPLVYTLFYCSDWCTLYNLHKVQIVFVVQIEISLKQILSDNLFSKIRI